MRILGLVFVFSGVVFSAPALALVPEDCAKTADSGERLLCYDGIFKVQKTTLDQPGDTKWHVKEERSKIDDTRTVFASIDSDDSFRSNFGGGSQQATMIVRCLEQKTSLMLHFGDHFMADVQGYGDVVFRIDGQKAFTKELTSSTDNKALGLWSGSSSISLIKQIRQSKSVVVRATPFNKGPLIVTFSTQGAAEAIDAVGSACKWS